MPEDSIPETDSIPSTSQQIQLVNDVLNLLLGLDGAVE